MAVAGRLAMLLIAGQESHYLPLICQEMGLKLLINVDTPLLLRDLLHFGRQDAPRNYFIYWLWAMDCADTTLAHAILLIRHGQNTAIERMPPFSVIRCCYLFSFRRLRMIERLNFGIGRFCNTSARNSAAFALARY